MVIVLLVFGASCRPNERVPSEAKVTIDGLVVYVASNFGADRDSPGCLAFLDDVTSPPPANFLDSPVGWALAFQIADARTRPTGSFTLVSEGAPYSMWLYECQRSTGCQLASGDYYDGVSGSVSITASTDRLSGTATFEARCRGSCDGPDMRHSTVVFDLDVGACNQ